MRRQQLALSWIGGLVVLLVAQAVAGCSGGGSDAAARPDGGDLEKAENVSRGVLEDEPANAVALYELGLVQQMSGEETAAEKNYRKALTIDPNYAPALFNLAGLRSEEGAPEEAVDLYRRLITVEPNNAGAHFNLGLLLHSMGRTFEAETALSQASRLDPAMSPNMATADSRANPR